MPDLRTAPVQSEALPAPLAQIARLLAESPCQHCGKPPYPVPVTPTPRTGHPDPHLPAGPEHGVESGAPPEVLDEVDDDERWLWRLVEEGERVTSAAPPAPSPAQLTLADDALTQAIGASDRLTAQVRTTEQAVANPASWLRPSRRAVLVKQLRQQQASAVIAAAHQSRAEQRQTALTRQAERRAAYLAEHRDTLTAAENARVELGRRIDDLIHAYGRMPAPPPWFRYGLGYPPDPTNYAQWLRATREAIAHRRRHGVDHPLEPRG